MPSADVIAAVSAGFTAIAAGAAWRSAWLSRKVIEDADLPRVEVQVVVANDTVMAAIINSGRGVARGVNVAIYTPTGRVEVGAGDGFLRPGERLHIHTEISVTTGARTVNAIVAYRDAENYVHYRTDTGKHRAPRRLITRRPKYPERKGLFRKLLPHADLDSEPRSASVRPPP
jgi:hypothetical protein